MLNLSYHLPLQKSWLRLWLHSLFLQQISSLSIKFLSLSCLRAPPYPTHHRFQHCSTVATSLVHSWLDYSNSLYHSLPVTQLKHLQQMQNALAHTIINSPKHLHITPELKSLHWLKVEQCIQYKIISITQNLLHKCQPTYLHNLIIIKTTCKTRSSDHLCLSLPPLTSKLKFSDCIFHNSSTRLWNSLPINLISL